MDKCVERREGILMLGVGLRQGCVMSPWLLDLFMDKIIKE